MKPHLTVAVILFVSLPNVRAGLLDTLGFGKKGTNETAALPAGLTASLSQDQVVQGLKEALGKGVQQAVSRLGHDDGHRGRRQVSLCRAWSGRGVGIGQAVGGGEAIY